MNAKPQPHKRMIAGWCQHCTDVIVRSRGEWIHADSLELACDPDRIHAARMFSTDRAEFETVPADHPILKA